MAKVVDLSYEFLINDLDITQYVAEGTKITLERNNQDGNTATINLVGEADGIFNFENGASITIKRGPTEETKKNIFTGILKKKKYDEDENRWSLFCKDELHKLKYRLLTYSYDSNIDPSQGEISAIFTDIASRGGFDVSTISSGTEDTDITLEKFVSNRKDYLGRLNLLSSILGWYFQLNYETGLIEFYPNGYETYSQNLVVGQNVANIPKWDEDISKMRNDITVLGATGTDTRIETFTGDGTTTSFSLSATPTTTEIKVEGILKVRGTLGDDVSVFDYSVDTDLNNINFQEAPNIDDEIIITYQTQVPNPVRVTSPDSISKYVVTQEQMFDFKDIITYEDAITRANQLLNKLKDSTLSSILYVLDDNIEVGMNVNVIDPTKEQYNNTYIVTSKIINYPSQFDVIDIGTTEFDINELFRNISDRLTALEGSDTVLTEILTNIINLERLFYFNRRATIGDVEDISTANTSAFDDPNYGFDDDNTYFDSDGGETNSFSKLISLGSGLFEERFYDNVFIDDDSTGTLDSVNGQYTIENEEVLISKRIKNGNVPSVRINITADNDEYLIEYSKDNGSNWITINNNELTNINSTQGLMYRIIANTGETCILSNVKIRFS